MVAVGTVDTGLGVVGIGAVVREPSVLGLIGVKQLCAEGGMPNRNEPSDHQIIAVRLAFCKERPLAQ